MWGRGRVTHDGESGDVRSSDYAYADDARRALAGGIVKTARLQLKLEGRTDWVKVTLGPGNTLHFNRDDEELERVVRELLLARGMIRLPARRASATARAQAG